MSQNIFDATLDPNNDVKVNNFDWSHANNLTTQIGRVTPIFCDLVPAKTSFRVNPRFGLQFMPMVFPIQTRMKARISWYRYPLRALWEDYKDFVGNFREGLEEPYIDFTSNHFNKMAVTGSLGDYLGLPSTIVGKFGENASINFSTTTGLTLKGYSIPSVGATNFTLAVASSNSSPAPLAGLFSLISTSSGSVTFSTGDFFRITVPVNDSSKSSSPLKVALVGTSDSGTVILSLVAQSVSASDDVDVYDFYYDLPDSVTVSLQRLDLALVGIDCQRYCFYDSSANLIGLSAPAVYVGKISDGVHDISLETSPWYSSGSPNKDKQQKILAYSFRAYEGIYNSFIRDNRNNPYYVDGKVQYNQWIPSMKGGADNNLYELRYANWEKDFLTTAVQSPQQGNAPLVGITTYTQTVQNEDGTITELVKTSLVDEDGKKYGLSFKTSDDGLEGVEYLELDNGTKVRQARSLYDLATSGISIPDLRMVNCYQKFLELNMRKGYSYKDIVEGRFDVKVRYSDLLMPEFFGGVSRDIDVNAVTQTVDQNVQGQTNDYDKALGSQAGLAGVRGEANANIECFCDEESIIMGILIVTPLPVYTQLLPKHFTYRGLMEHYQPEFNLIGFQPIKYNEVCPIQAYNDNPDSLFDTFGYNRPWYEYAQKYDVAHGLFRTDLSNFLMHRVFDKKPELAQSFLTVDPEQVTDVFAVTQTTDKIYGQIWLDITCKLPIARVAIPRLD
ncbi:major capsid protein [uncultured Bacteroides sp.]|uniref:major capsid protein n=1 Tax=uncultured Bacteroides sp. TaxID=162156 RepID=UPI000821D311|nr:major capsid protein [uncultured Bacteroides sp.]SCH20855.1 Capsid protein (F protein) [uncultured Bacteroides sp.]